MSIRVECLQCGRGVKAPSKYAGKIGKCPGKFSSPADGLLAVERIPVESVDDSGGLG